jgi:hypothetical protein
LSYYEFKVDPVSCNWHPEMIANPDAKFCFVFDARNVFRELTANGNNVMRLSIAEATTNYCKEQNIDFWYFGPKDSEESDHCLYTTTSSWIVELRMTKSTDFNIYNYLLRHLDHVEERNDQSIDCNS